MSITMRDRNRDGGDAGQRTLDRARVRATAAGLAELIRDSFSFGRLLEKTNQPRVMKGRAVCNINRGTQPKLCVIAYILTAIIQGQIIGGRGVNRDGQVRMKIL